MSNPTLEVVRLHFNSPLHLAKGKPGSYDAGFDILHSDTLKAAILAVAIDLFGSEVVAGQDASSCPFLDAFRISSGFPYWETELFFPRPLGVPISIAGAEDLDSAKRAKKIRFIGKQWFEALLAGEPVEIPPSALSEDGHYASPIFQHEPQQRRFISKRVVEQRVTVPRGTIDGEAAKDAGDAKPYFLERLYFREQAGLFFLLECRDNVFRDRLLQVLMALGENGIGLDRNTGNGHFELAHPALAPFDVRYAAAADRRVALSLFCPIPSETLTCPAWLDDSRYELLKRGGWVTSASADLDLSLRKKSVYMFAEGSVFPDGPLEGRLVDLKPEAAGAVAHPMWRDGRAIFLPLQTRPKQ